MERNRPVTIFGVIVLLLVCVVAVVASVTCVPEHPITTSLLTLAVILGGLAVIIAMQFLMFVPLLSIMSKLCGTNRKSQNAEHAGPGDVSTRA